MMVIETLSREEQEEEALRYQASDEEIEAAAEASAMSYTYQTSASRRCCR
jgi:hypothetical protein